MPPAILIAWLASAAPVNLHTVFDAARLEQEGRSHPAHKVAAGVLTTKGTLAAYDPLSGDLRPFARRVPPGKYPVEALVLGPDLRFGFARLVIAPGAPVRWELAVREGEDARALRPGQLYAYGVDSGTGCFTDAAVALPSSGADVLLKQLAGKPDAVARWPLTGDATLIAFASGYGDGVYASWWGLDAHGQPLELVTDFGEADFPRPEIPDDVAFRRQWARVQLKRLEGGGDDVYHAVSELAGLETDAAEVVPAVAAKLFVVQGDPMSADPWLRVAQRMCAFEQFQGAFLPWLAQAPSDAASRFVLNHRIRRMSPPFARAMVQVLGRLADSELRQALLELGPLELGNDVLRPFVERFAKRNDETGEAARQVLDRWRKRAGR